MDPQQRPSERSIKPVAQALEDIRKSVDQAFAQTQDAMRIADFGVDGDRDTSDYFHARFLSHMQANINAALNYANNLARHLSEMRASLDQRRDREQELTVHRAPENSILTTNWDELLGRLDQLADPSRVAAKEAVSSFLAPEPQQSRTSELIDETALSGIFDWAGETLARTALMAQEAVEHRRELLREMAARERQIDHRLAKTTRTLESLIAD